MQNKGVEPDLWSLTSGQPEIDPDRLAAAVEREASGEQLDFRTRLLIRDSVEALADWWGSQRLNTWLGRSPAKDRIHSILAEDLGPAGFPSLRSRLIQQTRPDSILQSVQELGLQTRT